MGAGCEDAVTTQALEALLALFLMALLLGLLLELGRFEACPASPKTFRHGPRLLRPRTPNDCWHCRDAAKALPAAPARAVEPYAQRKSPRVARSALTPVARLVPTPSVTIARLPTRRSMPWWVTDIMAGLIPFKISTAKPAIANSQPADTHPYTGSDPQPPASLRSCTPLRKDSAHTVQRGSSISRKEPLEVGLLEPACIRGAYMIA